ncbi:unnamed protein product, partial [Arabidopsis halleri]
ACGVQRLECPYECARGRQIISLISSTKTSSVMLSFMLFITLKAVVVSFGVSLSTLIRMPTHTLIISYTFSLFSRIIDFNFSAVT